MKKILSIIIAALTLLGTVLMAGCAEKQPVKDDVTTAAPVQTAVTAEPEETLVPDDLPEISFEGKPFRVILQSDSEGDIFTENHETSEPLHDAVFRRNKMVCDRFGVELEVMRDNYTAVNASISRSVKAKSDDYDLCFVHMVSGATLAQSNLVLPIHKLPYIDLSKP